MGDNATRAALKAMADAIGDRDGLSQLEKVFAELDIDNSGELEFDEFTQGLAHFGATHIADDTSLARAMFDAIDKDRSGRLSIEEFSDIAKVQLEFNILDAVLPEGGEQPANSTVEEKMAQDPTAQTSTEGTHFGP